MEWIFDGLGTELIITFIGIIFAAVGAGTIIYKKKSRNKQSAKGERVLQQQVGGNIQNQNLQLQEAGDNATQLTIGKYYAGIDEKRVREVVDEKYEVFQQETIDKTIQYINERNQKFIDSLSKRMRTVEIDNNELAEPSFQILLNEAQKVAAATEREKDYELLSELIVHRIKKGGNRKIRVGINEAIKIVGEIDDDALQGLTLVYSLVFFPKMGGILEGLDILDKMFGKLMYDNLPTGTDWIEHLDLLRAVRIESASKFKKTQEIYSDKLNGYVCNGIKQDSEQYNEALRILKENKIASNILMNHELKDGYARLGIASISTIQNIEQLRQYIKNGNQLDRKKLEIISTALSKIYSLYDKDKRLQEEINTNFMEEWNKRPNLKKFGEWLDSLEKSFEITAIGEVLAYANAEKYSDEIPKFNIDAE